MNILHFYKTYYPDSVGGVEQVIYQLAEGGRELGINAAVLALSPVGSSRNGCHAHHVVHTSRQDFFIASTGFSFSAFSDFRDLARQADIIHYHFPWPFMDLVHFVVKTGKPSLVTYHSDIVKQKVLNTLYQPLMNRFLASVDRIVCTSPGYLQSSPVLQQHRQKTSVVPIGLAQVDYPPVDESLLRQWRARVGERFFLFVGALRYYKGLHTLLDAMSGTDWPVVIVGAGPMEAALKEQAMKLGLQRIHFLGAVADEDKRALLELSGFFVFPSHLRSEAFGISLLEAALYGKPLISCEIGTGTSYINQDGVTGIVVPPESSATLRDAMGRLWADKALSQRCGQAARQRYEALFTAEKMLAGYQKVYADILH